MQFRLLGPFEIETRNGRAVTLPRRRERALLGVLLLRANLSTSMDDLIDLLWDGHLPKNPKASLQSHVSRVRAALSKATREVLIRLDAHGYRLTCDPHWIDITRFRADLHAARGEHDPQARFEALDGALRLWRGPVLADLLPEALRQRLCARLEEERAITTQEWIAAGLDAGRHHDLLPRLSELTAAAPLQERLIELHVRALYEAGRRTDALGSFDAARRRLADELGLDPGPDLIRLHAAVLRGDRTPNLAKHPGNPPNQLPAGIGFFTGRIAELESMGKYLEGAGDDPRIVVVTGPAGVGKTALAVHWARQAAGDFPDGLLFLDLAGHERASALSPGAALVRLLHSLGDRGEGTAGEPGVLAARYRSIVANRRMVLVLDNASGTQQVLALLPPDGSCAVIVTSRMRMSSLDTYHPVLTVDLDMLTTSEALTLLDRVVGAERLAGEPQAARDIADLCGRLPLALRIAASRLRTEPSRTAADLARELSHSSTRLSALATDDRARSVRAAFDATYRNLEQSAARAFRLIGACPGETVSVELLTALHGSAPADVRTLEAAHLIKRADRGRYAMHDLIRLFAAERAASDETPGVRRQWTEQILAWYGSVGRAAITVIAPHIDRHPAVPPPPAGLPFTLEQQSIMDWCTHDRHTIAAVVRLAREGGHAEVAWRLADMLGACLLQTSLWPELVEISTDGLSCAAQLGDVGGMYAMHSLLGVAEAGSGRHEIGLVHLRRAVGIMQPTKRDQALGAGYNNIGRACQLLGRLDEARAAYEQAAEHFRRAGVPGLITALGNLSLLHLDLGETDTALGLARQTVDTCRRMGDTVRENYALMCLADAQAARGEAAAALDSYRQALVLHRRIGDRELEPATLDKMAGLHQALGEPDIAAAQLAEAAELRRRFNL